MYAKLCLALGIASLFLTTSRADDWPAFRGPLGNGTSAETNAPVVWSASQNVRWKVSLPKPANGSAIVARGHVFLAGAQDDRGTRRSLFCYRRDDGSQKWVQTVKLDKQMPTHATNPHGGSTPVADGERVVVWHGSAGLHCYDFDGKPLWSRDLGEYRHMWGYGTSPILHRGRVILHTGPGQHVSLLALSLETGETIWETEEPLEGTDRRNDGKYLGSWTTPLVTRVNGREQILCTMPTRLIAVDPGNGTRLWTCDGIRGPKGDLAYSSPILAGDICVAIGGFGGPGMGVRLGGSGGVTTTHRIWRREKNPQSIGSGVYVDGYIYRPNAGPGTIECIDPASGDTLWTDRAAGANHWSSIVYVGGRCYATDQRGTTVVFNPTPDKFVRLSTNRLNETTNATPAFSGGEFFIRTHQSLFCIGQ